VKIRYIRVICVQKDFMSIATDTTDVTD
jgi:hypothetical protein